MRRTLTAICLGTVITVGCSTARDSVQTTDPELGDNHQATVVDSLAIANVRDWQNDVDSVAALYEFGDIADFLAARDSLSKSLEQLAATYPEVRSQPEFMRVLRSLADLDSALTAKTYIDETDSLALATEEWPETLVTVPEPESFSSHDSVFPDMSNDRIDFWIRYFTGPGRERFERALYRMQLYRPVVQEILTEMNLPKELICVPIIESGFNMKARSRARAVGPWQFIAGTARIYGLRVNWWYDERRDIIASTYAAGNYLNDLYGLWESWPLALAAYNCGEYRVARAVAYQKTTNFWKLNLPKQTERYVPKFLATLYILRDPEKFGFAIPDVEPVKFDEVTTKAAIDLKLVAQSAGASVEILRDLNPAILQWATPPNMEIALKVPTGTGEICEQKLAEIPPEELMTWRKHRVSKGETLSLIARKYDTSIAALKDLNGIRNAHRIRVGQNLIVPVPGGSYADMASTASPPQYKTARRNIDKAALEKHANRAVAPSNYKRTTYVVKSGDTLGEIAEAYHTRASKIRYWNNLRYRSYIYPGQRLTIYVPPSFDVAQAETSATPQQQPTGTDWIKSEYTIRKGDTFYSISKRFNVDMVDLLAWNNKTRRSVIYPGQTIDIWRKR